jgi:hypothetical protein
MIMYKIEHAEYLNDIKNGNLQIQQLNIYLLTRIKKQTHYLSQYTIFTRQQSLTE